MVRRMRELARRAAAVAAVAVGLSLGVAVVPASAATSPDWVPLQSALPSSAIDERFTNSYYTRKASKSAQLDTALATSRLRKAADSGAYIPGLTDIMRDTGRTAFEVTDAEVKDHFAKYNTRPGSTSAFLPATVSTSGVVTVTDSKGLTKTMKGPKGGGKQTFMKIGNGLAVASAAFGAAEIGVSVGTGIASMVGLPTSGSFVCDVKIALGNTCSYGFEPSYSINMDVVDVVAGQGWAGYLAPHLIDKFHQPNPELTSEGVWRWTMEESPTNREHLIVHVLNAGDIPTAYYTNSWKGGVVTQDFVIPRPGQPVTLGSSIGGIEWLGRTVNWTPPAGSTQVRDRVEVWINEGGPAYNPANKTFSGFKYTWYPLGHPERPSDVEDDPRRRWVSEWTCQDGGTGTARSEWFRESEAIIPVPDAKCTGSEVAALTVSQTTEGYGTEVVYEWTMPERTGDFLEKYPDCAKGTCLLDLKTTKTGTEVSCFMSPELCTDWLKDPAKDTDFQCYYGGEKVPLSECFLYGPTFNRAKVEKTPYGNPRDGTDPVDDPATGPGTDPGTGPGTETPPVEAFDPNCPPKFTAGGLFSGWWVYKGASCAIKEAFVPSKTVIASQVSTVKARLDTKPPFTLVQPVKATFDGFKGGWDGACTNPIAQFDPFGKGQLTVPCSPPQSAPLTALYGLAVAAIVAATAFGVWHMLTAALGGNDAGVGD